MLYGQEERCIGVTPEDKVKLERLIRSGKTEQRVALRSRIVLAAAEGIPNNAIAEALGTSRPTVTDWRKRYAAAGIAGLTNARPRGKPFMAWPKDKESVLKNR